MQISGGAIAPGSTAAAEKNRHGYKAILSSFRPPEILHIYTTELSSSITLLMIAIIIGMFIVISIVNLTNVTVRHFLKTMVKKWCCNIVKAFFTQDEYTACVTCAAIKAPYSIQQSVEDSGP